ncbi:hypothetical protein ACFWYE_30450 [Mesorhizobium sp. NPDC059025]|uniref:hypothetical protein n=1 Tax=Mesorhizobium sp. NPDC059025 TaxID=3346708 RepID=UPI0036B8AEF7
MQEYETLTDTSTFGVARMMMLRERPSITETGNTFSINWLLGLRFARNTLRTIETGPVRVGKVFAGLTAMQCP